MDGTAGNCLCRLPVLVFQGTCSTLLIGWHSPSEQKIFMKSRNEDRANGTELVADPAWVRPRNLRPSFFATTFYAWKGFKGEPSSERKIATWKGRLAGGPLKLLCLRGMLTVLAFVDALGLKRYHDSGHTANRRERSLGRLCPAVERPHSSLRLACVPASFTRGELTSSLPDHSFLSLLFPENQQITMYSSVESHATLRVAWGTRGSWYGLETQVLGWATRQHSN